MSSRSNSPTADEKVRSVPSTEPARGFGSAVATSGLHASISVGSIRAPGAACATSSAQVRASSRTLPGHGYATSA